MQNLQESVQRFFEYIKAGKTKEAYENTTEEFKTGGSLEDFKNFLEGTGLGHFTEIFFDGLEQNGDIAALKGTIVLADQRKVPIIIYLKQENQQWKIHNVTPAIENSSGIALPDQSTLLSVIHKYLTLFVSCIQQEEFTPFYTELAELWKVETNPVQIKEIFRNFIEKNVDLSFVLNTSPVISEQPLLDEKGLITVKGYYPSATQTLLFELILTYQHPEWKLVSIKISEG